MSNSASSLPTIIDDMNAIYSFIYKDWNVAGERAKYLTREVAVMNIRHLIRYMIQRERGATYQRIAKAEAAVFNISCPDHTTIMNSIRVVKETLYDEPAVKKWIHRIGFFYDLRKSTGGNSRETINRFMSLPPHVLAVTLAGISEQQLIHRALLQTLINEYSELDAEFVSRLLATQKVAQHA